jgi:environmental stress-induced protein Ves
VAVHAEPWGDEPVKDCNLMVRRAFGAGRMRWVAGTESLAPLQCAGAMRMLLAPRGGALRCGAERIDLASGDAAIVEHPGCVDLEAEQDILLIEIEPYNV